MRAWGTGVLAPPLPPGHPLRERCEERIRALGVPQPVQLDVLCARVAALRGRPLVLMPEKLAHGAAEAPCGLWLAKEDHDVIVYDVTIDSGSHRLNTIAHEVGHIVMDHPPDLEHLERYRAHVDGRAVTKILARTNYDTEQEREAEVFAWLLLGRAWRRDHRALLAHVDERIARAADLFSPQP